MLNRDKGQVNIVLSPRKVVRVFLAVMVFLFLARVATAYWHYCVGHPDRFGLMRQFNTNIESNAPTFFSVLLLLISAVLLGLIAASKKRSGDRYTRHWGALSLLMLYLSVDEACQIHEYWGEYASFLRGTSVYLDQFSWVTLGVLVVLGVGLLFLKFLLSLPRRWKITFAAAGFVYVVFGALGGEILSAVTHVFEENQRVAYAVVETFEEFSEMGGIVILIWGLLTYMEAHGISFLISSGCQEKHDADEPRSRESTGVRSRTGHLHKPAARRRSRPLHTDPRRP